MQQLYMLYNRTNFESLLRHSSNRSISENIFSDIYDGEIWKSFLVSEGEKFFLPEKLDEHLGLSLNVDWFQPFTHSAYSTGAIYAIINNLPRSIRFKPENILILGLLPGPHEPKLHEINNYLAPLVNELVTL